MAKGIKKEIVREISSISQTAIIELFRLYYNYQEDPQAVLHFHGGTNNLRSSIYFDDQEYIPLAVETEGFEVLGDQRLPRPKIKISNAGLYMSSILRKYKNLNNAKIERRRIFAKYLDDRNFDGGVNPWGMANPSARMPDDKYFISQKLSENKLFVEFELVSSLELENNNIPGREVASRYCPWIYRGQGCRYGSLSSNISGTSDSDGRDRPVANINDELFVVVDSFGETINAIINPNSSSTYDSAYVSVNDLRTATSDTIDQSDPDGCTIPLNDLKFIVTTSTNGNRRYIKSAISTDLSSAIEVYFYWLRPEESSWTAYNDSPENGEILKLQYSKNGTDWSDLLNIIFDDAISENTWQKASILAENIPADAKTNVYLRMTAEGGLSSTDEDNWVVHKLYTVTKDTYRYKLNPKIFDGDTRTDRQYIFNQNLSSGCLTNKGAWESGVTYLAGDYVHLRSQREADGRELTANFYKKQNVYYVCKDNHTSSAANHPLLDKTKWVKDSCSKKLSGCKARYDNENYESLTNGYDGLNNQGQLPFGGFPGTDLYEY